MVRGSEAEAGALRRWQEGYRRSHQEALALKRAEAVKAKKPHPRAVKK
ncbi:MAG: hypothetical protein ABSH49_00190 [Bryobacteraceae bacterium]